MTLSLQGPFGRVTIEVPVFSIGRAPDNTLVINDPNVSGHHAAIHTNMPAPSIVDLGSTNGTFVNGQQIERNVPRPLRSGDQVRVGDTVCTFEDSSAAEVEPTLKPADRSVIPPTVFARPPEQTPNNSDQAVQSNQQPFPSPYVAPATPSFVPITPQPQQPQQPQQPLQQPQQLQQSQPQQQWSTSSSSPNNNAPTEYAPQQPQQQPQQPQQWQARGSSPDNSAPTEYVPPQQWGTSSSSPNNNAPTEYAQPAQPQQPVQPMQPWASNPGVPVTPSYPNQMAPQAFPNNANPSYPGVPVTPNQSYPNAANPQGYQYNQFPQQPGMQPARKKMSGGMKALLIIVVVLVVLGIAGGAIAGYALTRPQPVIAVTSQYKVGSNYAGSTSTSFSIKGQKFTGSSAITFLLDGTTVPGSKTVQSDKDGNVTTTLNVTDAWTVGSHTLTAKDADGYTTKTGVAINVVAQGQANTPGPNGAPSDSSSYILRVTVQDPNSSSSNINELLSVTGKPDPDGGTICDPLVDNGVAHTVSGKSTNGVSYKETIALTCSGTYKAGKVTYDEKATKDSIVFSNGLNCTVQTPYTFQHLDGTFSSATAASGNFSRDSVTVNCDHGVGLQQLNGRQGTWTGQV